MLEIKHLKVNYGEIQAVKGVDITVGDGEAVAIIGANGAGKTSLLSAIVGWNRQVSGTIVFDGVEVTSLHPWKIVKQGIAIVPEGRHVFGAMTVQENLEIGAYSVRNRMVVSRGVKQAYETFPKLRDRSHQLAASLSGGEQQMLAIARALISQPKLLLLDEPSMGLSPVASEQTYECIAQVKQSGTSILLVEQNAELAFSITDRGYVLQNGLVYTDGDITSLRQNDLIREAYLGV